VYASADGFLFTSAEGKADYEARRVELQVLDAHRGAWSATSTSVSAPFGAQSSATAAKGAGDYSEHVVAQYRFATGEGLVLATCTGERLDDPRRLLGHIGQLSLYDQRGHSEGSSAVDIRNTRTSRVGQLATIIAGLGLIAGGTAMELDPDREDDEQALPATVLALGMGGFVGGSIWAITTPPLVPRHWVRDPWYVSDALPLVRAWNQQIREKWGIR
jgi:hypothetical protein